MIEPTVGRIVHYYYQNALYPTPMAAVITNVHNNRLVDITVFPPCGVKPLPVEAVSLVQPEDDADPKRTKWVEWMPYQVKGKSTGSESGEKEAGRETI